MQCKPVTALPANEKWTFEIKFDGYRCIVVKRGSEVTLFSRNEKVLNKRFPKVVDALASLGATSFSMASWSPWIRKGNLPFRFSKATCCGPFRFISASLSSRAHPQVHNARPMLPTFVAIHRLRERRRVSGALSPSHRNSPRSPIAHRHG